MASIHSVTSDIFRNDIKTAKRNKLDKPLFPLMLLGMRGDTFNFDYADLGVKIASTWTYD